MHRPYLFINVIALLLAVQVVVASLAGCKATAPLSGGTSELAADGSTWNLSNMSDDTFQAIKSACNDPLGARDLGISVEECYLVMTGSTVRESSWNAQKSCEAWGNAGDPCCGLTQSRRGDARAVGLSCDPQAKNAAGYACNVLTGLRNIGCKASQGADCKKYGSDGSLYTGVKKHLGYNTGALSSYVQGMKDSYQRDDMRIKFAISNDMLRSWDEVFYKTRATAAHAGSSTQHPVSAAQQALPQATPPAAEVLAAAGPGAGPSSSVSSPNTNTTAGSSSDQVWTDAYSKATFPYCGPGAIDPDGDGWGWDNLKSCKVRGR